MSQETFKTSANSFFLIRKLLLARIIRVPWRHCHITFELVDQGFEQRWSDCSIFILKFHTTLTAAAPGGGGERGRVWLILHSFPLPVTYFLLLFLLIFFLPGVWGGGSITCVSHLSVGCLPNEMFLLGLVQKSPLASPEENRFLPR